jgi:outer membrane protein OmpA-like peptidoglycan-associated protein
LDGPRGTAITTVKKFRAAFAATLVLSLFVLIAPSASIVGADTPNIGDLPVPAASIVANSGGTFSAVSCATATQCTAVGTDAGNDEPFHVTESNGIWSNVVEFGPNSDGSGEDILTGIDCVDTLDCSAVGYDVSGSTYEPVTISETDGVWGEANTSLTPNSESVLTGVSCSGVGQCTAVGGGVFGEGPIYESDVDGSWSGGLTIPSALPGDFYWAISCFDSMNCTVVGHDGNALPIALSETSGEWGFETALPLPNEYYATLDGVSCTSAIDCVAVGSDDGTNNPVEFTETAGNWSAGVDVPTPGGPGFFDAVSCTSTGNCSAVGSDFTSNEPSSDFEVAGTWLPGTDALAPEGSGFFTSVSCVLAASCEAVGQDSGANEPMYDNAVTPAVSTLPPPPQMTTPTTTTTAVPSTTTTTSTTPVATTTTTNVPPVATNYARKVTVYFSRNSSALSLSDKAALRRFARSVVVGRWLKVTIVGYASPPGTAALNQRLSLRRATAAATDLRHVFRDMNDNTVSISVRGGGILRSSKSSANRVATASS